ncbi:MAG: Trk system potassium transport protein TrkA [Treponema sp.]|jgi:trk system potassium uptake protein TrkA|nr:Trk system potassium transport protein TrkA [Treponema sp.]
MRIIIVGAGTVGSQLARQLISEKHDVSIIEPNEERARHASNRLDCQVVHDAGNSMSALEDAGVTRADAIICVTESDEVNMIVCGLASTRNSKMIKIARVRNDDYVRLSGAGEHVEGNRVLGIDWFVHPDVEASRSVLDAIEHGALGDILSFPGTPYDLCSVDIIEDCAFDGLALKNYHSLDTGESLVTLLERQGECMPPTGSTVLHRGDRIHILAKESEMENIFRLVGRTEKPLRKIGIVGGGRLGVLIAEGILGKSPENPKGKGIFSFFKKIIPRMRNRLTIIEHDYALCKELTARFPQALILNEDITDESFITEEQIDDLDLIITTTDQQELNIITAVYLKSRGVRRAIAMVTSPSYAAIARKLGIDVVIPMKSVVVDSILTHMIGGGVRGVHRLGDGSVNILELEIGAEAPVAGKALKDCRLPTGCLIMLITRNGEAFIPRGDSELRATDRIVLIAKNGAEGEIGRLFGGAS